MDHPSYRDIAHCIRRRSAWASGETVLRGPEHAPGPAPGHRGPRRGALAGRARHPFLCPDYQQRDRRFLTELLDRSLYGPGFQRFIEATSGMLR